VDTLNWLLDSDPAIRWQVMRDLADSSPEDVAAERARVAQTGLGAAILALQASDGSWRRSGTRVWLSTLFTFLLLRSTGADPADPLVQAAVSRLSSNLCWNDQPFWDLRPKEFGGNPFFQGEVEPCINGAVLAIGAYFGYPNETLARRLLGEQLSDGGWNCEAPKSTRSSFHTTICVLEGLLEYERSVVSAPEVAAARLRAEAYLLDRSLFRRLSTGQVANPGFLELAFPPRYHYDILRALDYFRNAGTQPDARMSEAIGVLQSKQQADGRWLLDRAYDEALALPLGETAGHPSRWNTLRALRVQCWFRRS